MKFDEVLHTYLGEFGKYQKIQFFLVCVPTIFTALHALSWTFTAAIVPHRCLLPDENSSVPFDLKRWGENLSLPNETLNCMRFEGVNPWGGLANNSESLDENMQSCVDGYKWDHSHISKSAVSRWEIVCDRAWIRAVVQSMYYVGQFFGSVIFGYLGDRYGRKIIFFIAITLQLVCGTVMSFIPHWIPFAILRIGVGFAHPGIFVIAVVIGMELVGPSKRKMAGVITGVFFALGQIILGGLAYFIRDYQILQLAISVPAVVFIVYYWIVPESSRWLVSVGRIQDATAILTKAAKINGRILPPDWYESLDAEKPAPHMGMWATLSQLLRTPELRKRTLVCFVCWPVVSMVYYGISMNPSFLGGDPYVTFIIAGAMEIPGLLLVFLTIDRWGRKVLCCGGYLVASLCLFTTLIVPEKIKWLNVIQIIVSKTAITWTYATVYTFTPELFPTPFRNSAMGSCSMVARIGAISASYVAMWLVVHSKLAMVLLFASLSLVAGILSLLLPETMGRPLPESVEDVEENPNGSGICGRRDQSKNSVELEELNPDTEKNGSVSSPPDTWMIWRCDSPGFPDRSSPMFKIVGDNNSSSDSSYSNKQNVPRPNRDPMSHRIIEKRRRDRMNNCLTNLSKLIPNSYLKKGRGRIEKTEIIEMAIGYMKSMQAEIRTSNKEASRGSRDSSKSLPYSYQRFDSKVAAGEMKLDSIANNSSMIMENNDKYKEGFYDCIAETVRFLTTLDPSVLTETCKSQVMEHLQNCFTNARSSLAHVDEPLNMSLKMPTPRSQDLKHPSGALNTVVDMVTSSSHEGIIESAPAMKAPRLLRALTMHDVPNGVGADSSNRDGSCCGSSTTHYPSSPSSTQSLSGSSRGSHPGDSPPRVLSPFQGGLLGVASPANPGIPIFALHPSGLYYIPGTVSAMNVDHGLIQALASTGPVHGSACHSVTITVNFSPNNNNNRMQCNPVLINSSNPPSFTNQTPLSTNS